MGHVLCRRAVDEAKWKFRPKTGGKQMNKSSIVRIAGMILIVSSVLWLSGCSAMVSRMRWDGVPVGPEPPFSGVKFSAMLLLTSGEDISCVTKLVFAGDLPLTFLVDTVLVPVDLVDMSRDPVFHGQVLNGVTGEPMRNVVVLAGADTLRGMSLRMLADRKKSPRRLRERLDYQMTRTDRQGRFVFHLHRGALWVLDGFSVIAEGYAPAWLETNVREDWPHVRDKERHRQMPAIRLFPEGATGDAP
jgi:uncharacterized protein YceK